MMTILQAEGSVLQPSSTELLQQQSDDADHALWIALEEPDEAELSELEALLGIEISRPETLRALEVSEILYMDNGNLYMTAVMLSGIQEAMPSNDPISFIITPKFIVSVSHVPYKSIRDTTERARTEMSSGGVNGILVYLLEILIDRLSDYLSGAGRKSDQLSQQVFRGTHGGQTKELDFTNLLKNIGNAYDVISYVNESLTSFYRLIEFAKRNCCVVGARYSAYNTEAMSDLESLSRDITALLEQANFESNKLTFMLDATLGLISIEQSSIIKIFSVLAVVLMPPTLVASIYGMNFELMPELKMSLGYPLALALMLLSAVGTYSYFKYKKWL